MVYIYAQQNSSQKVAFLKLLAKAAVIASGSELLASPKPPPEQPLVIRSPEPTPEPAAYYPGDIQQEVSAMIAGLDLADDRTLEWSDLKDVRHLQEGGTSTIYTAEYNRQLVVAKVSKCISSIV